MTNELGTTLSDIEAKAERKREVILDLSFVENVLSGVIPENGMIASGLKTIRKYIEES